MELVLPITLYTYTVTITDLADLNLFPLFLQGCPVLNVTGPAHCPVLA